MSRADDISTLYKRFGGNAATYQEIGASESSSSASQRWPLLGEVSLQGTKEAPPAQKGGMVHGDRQLRSFKEPPPQNVNPPEMPPALEGAVDQVSAEALQPKEISSVGHVVQGKEGVQAPGHEVPLPTPAAKQVEPEDVSAQPSFSPDVTEPVVAGEGGFVSGGGARLKAKAADPEDSEHEASVIHLSTGAGSPKLRAGRSIRAESESASWLSPMQEPVVKRTAKTKKSKPLEAEPAAPLKKKSTVKKISLSSKKRPEQGPGDSSLVSVFGRLAAPERNPSAQASPATPKKAIKW